ncbi:MAG: hypothetical protein AAFY98_07730 [Verrucomicrobiota bacterium]
MIKVYRISGLLIFIAIALNASVWGQTEYKTKEGSIELKDIDTVELPSGASEGESTISEYSEDWWFIEIEFETEPEVTDELTVKVYLEGYDLLGRDEDPMANPITLTSEITFINLLEGKHVATFYLHPGAAKRFGGDKARDFKKYIYRVEIESGRQLEFEGDSDDELDEGWHRESPIPDILLPVHLSPWWPSESNRYPQIKIGRN